MSTLKTPDNAKEGVVAHCARKRGRSRGFRMSEAHRGKIKNSSILNALIEYFQGRREMSATQVSVGLRLLKKVLPDLQPVTPEFSVAVSRAKAVGDRRARKRTAGGNHGVSLYQVKNPATRIEG